jgi:L-rhamnose mutarotase
MCKVKESKVEEYKNHHRQVWPEMLDALRRTGWHNYSLFMREDGLMFGYFETVHSFNTASAAIAKEEINTKWDELMVPLFEPRENGEGTFEIELEEVFHVD